ncbi:MAG: hypothetical protein ABF289_16005 [Clostridiales bacterium]
MNYIQSARSLRAIFNQSAFWYSGVKNVSKEKKYILNKFKKYERLTKFNINYLLIKEFVINVEWFLGPLIFILSFLYSLLFFNLPKKVIIVVYILTIILNYNLTILVFSNLLNKKKKAFKIALECSFLEKLIVFSISPLRGIWRCFGPFISYYLLFKAWLKNKKPNYVKTER